MLTKLAIVAGIANKLDAKITGITDAVFNLIGKNDCSLPYEPVVLLAYWRGILRSASWTYITPTIITKYARIKPTNFKIPRVIGHAPPVNTTSSLKAAINVDGKVDIIPAIIIKLTPLPIPFWVIWSPNHKQKAVPAVKITATYK